MLRFVIFDLPIWGFGPPPPPPSDCPILRYRSLIFESFLWLLRAIFTCAIFRTRFHPFKTIRSGRAWDVRLVAHPFRALETWKYWHHCVDFETLLLPPGGRRAWGIATPCFFHYLETGHRRDLWIICEMAGGGIFGVFYGPLVSVFHALGLYLVYPPTTFVAARRFSAPSTLSLVVGDSFPSTILCLISFVPPAVLPLFC